MRVRHDRNDKAVDDLRSYGQALVRSVPSDQARAAAGRAMFSRNRHLVVGRRRRRLVVALGALGLLTVSNVGLAAVANTASPGEFLYSFDRGYEWVADLVGAKDHTGERLAEAQVLNARGETAQAIALLRESLNAEKSDHALLASAIQTLEFGRQNQIDQTGVESPSLTAPGQIAADDDPPTPSDTAPGRPDSLPSQSDNAPPVDPAGTQDPGEDSSPSETAPGQNRDTTTTTLTTEKANRNGNGGVGNPDRGTTEP